MQSSETKEKKAYKEEDIEIIPSSYAWVYLSVMGTILEFSSFPVAYDYSQMAAQNGPLCDTLTEDVPNEILLN